MNKNQDVWHTIRGQTVLLRHVVHLLDKRLCPAGGSRKISVWRAMLGAGEVIAVGSSRNRVTARAESALALRDERVQTPVYGLLAPVPEVYLTLPTAVRQAVGRTKALWDLDKLLGPTLAAFNPLGCQELISDRYTRRRRSRQCLSPIHGTTGDGKGWCAVHLRAREQEHGQMLADVALLVENGLNPEELP